MRNEIVITLNPGDYGAVMDRLDQIIRGRITARDMQAMAHVVLDILKSNETRKVY
jgi:hypothetical protein